ncbi:hypothetical protein DEU56DRAFT_978218 [Suillus clintonianus]|uniref:uncharacterized protein n=1 Tax=Suillus clintonianus TaxID=1904413 RepID=UPI001B88032F|nr:uncharacterized protein DEU56DRAFT_978218 [Suillus clintonianus]KAG2147945.1 hypothetical protein DEU56DRAFT_978218 [Suillus clintonianus]
MRHHLSFCLSLSSDSRRSFYWIADAPSISRSVSLSEHKPVVRQQPLFLLDDGCVTISRPVSLSVEHADAPAASPARSSSLASSDQSRSFYWMTDASPSPVPSVFPLNITTSLSSDSSRSFYWTTDASPSPVPTLFPNILKPVVRQLSLFLPDRGCAFHFTFPSFFIYRPTHVAPSYTPFTFLFHHIYCPTHVTPSYTPFTFLLPHIYRPTHAAPSTYTPFTFLFPHIYRPAHAAPSTYTHFSFLFHFSSDPRHSFNIYPFLLSVSFIVRPSTYTHLSSLFHSSSDPRRSFNIYPFLLHRPTHVTHSTYTHFSFIVRPTSLLQHIPLSPFTFRFHLIYRPDHRHSPHSFAITFSQLFFQASSPPARSCTLPRTPARDGLH